MTIVVFRNGVMASDTGSWCGDACQFWVRKIGAGPDGTLYGCAGNAARVQGFLDWVAAGCVGQRPTPKPSARDPDTSDFIVLIASPTRPGVELLTAFGVEKYPNAAYFAIGAPAPVAFGALFAGADAEMAVRAALVHGNGAAGQVFAVRFPEAVR